MIALRLPPITLVPSRNVISTYSSRRHYTWRSAHNVGEKSPGDRVRRGRLIEI